MSRRGGRDLGMIYVQHKPLGALNPTLNGWRYRAIASYPAALGAFSNTTSDQIPSAVPNTG